MYNIMSATHDFETCTNSVWSPTPFYNAATLYCVVPMLYLYIAVTVVTVFLGGPTMVGPSPLPIERGKAAMGHIWQ